MRIRARVWQLATMEEKMRALREANERNEKRWERR